MSTTSQHTELLRTTLLVPSGGVVGLVDALLRICREHHLQLDWQAEHCRVRTPGGKWEDVLDEPLRKSVSRAILARIAALCNERAPNSVSPYGGQGELFAGAGSAVIFSVSFANTPGEQKLELACHEQESSISSRSPSNPYRSAPSGSHWQGQSKGAQEHR